MKGILCVLLLFLLMPTAYAASLPGDSANGKKKKCQRFHAYRTATLSYWMLLKTQLASCTHMANKEFSESETQDLLSVP